MSEEAGTTGSTTGSTTETVTEAATEATSGAGTAAVSAAPSPQWFESIDKDSMGWLQNKQYFGSDLSKADLAQGITAMIKAHRGMESIMGRNRLPVPKDAADEEGWNTVYAALGRPADPSGYEFKAPEGGDQKIADNFAQIAFKHGLSTRQMQGMAADWQVMATEINGAAKAAAEAQFMTASKADLDSLRSEWGQEANARFAAAQRAGVALGLDETKMDKIERALGTKEFVSLMANIGASLSEDRGAGGGGGGQGGPNTVEAVRARMAELKADRLWRDKYMAGGAAEVEEWSRLEQKLAASMAA